MSNFKDFLRDAGYLGVGAVATVAEVGSKAVKALVSKGEQTLRENQDTVDEIKRKAKELGDKVKTSVEKATQPDAASMTPEERAELRRQLDEADLADAQPVEADVIYHTEEPAPEETEAPAEEPVSDEEPQSVPEEPPVLEVPEDDDPRDPFSRF